MSPAHGSVRRYWLLLRLLPSVFRRRFGDAMTEDFAQLLATDIERLGVGAGRSSAWRRALGDLLGTLRREWQRVGRDARRRTSARARRSLYFALRGLRRRPWLAAATVLTLAIGLGGAVGALGLLRAALWSTAPGVGNPERVVSVFSQRGDDRLGALSFPDFVDLDGAGVFSAAAAASTTSVNLSGAVSERVTAGIVSPGFFEVLAVELAAGRTFGTNVADQDLRVALVSWELAAQLHGRPHDAVGEELEINGHRYRIIGVTPTGFRGAWIHLEPRVWVPTSRIGDVVGYFGSAVDGSGSRILEHRGYSMFQLLGRLHDTDSPAVIQQRLDRVSREVRAANENYPLELVARPLSHAAFDTRQRGAVTDYVQLTAAVAGLALLIGLANATILHTLRADGRRQEIALRRALGARGVDILAELAAEALVLTALGATGALLIASRIDVAVDWLHLPASIRPAWQLGWPEAALAGALSVIAAALLAAGSLVATRSRALHRGSQQVTGATLIANGAVVLQVAVSVALITCAGLLGRSMLSLTAVDAGFSARNVVIASIDLEPLGYDEGESMVFWAALRDRLAALPRSRAVAITSDAPLSASRGMQEFYVPGVAEDEMPDVGHTMVTTGFFESLGVALRSGRTFTTADNLDSERVVVVNAPFAEKYWPGGDAADKLIGESAAGPWYRVVGVVAAHRHADLRSPGAARVFWPLQQLGRWRKGSAIRTVMLATDMPDGEAVAALRTTVDQLDPNLPIFDVGSLQRQVVAATAPERQVTALLATLAAIAVLLCGLGLVAVLGRWVTRRQHEIGIRLAVGAAPRDVVKLVVVRAVWLVGAGAALGLLAYRSLAGLLTHYLYGVGFTDTVTLMAVGVTAVLLALAVCIAPARRAASTDPVVAIRAE